MSDPATARYDRIGLGYAGQRVPDPRIEAAIERALGGGESLLNVGAGAGSYEPARAGVVAVEPSRVMIAQRGPEKAPVVRAQAEALPFRDQAFDAALASLTIHHWADPVAGLRELSRVAGRTVVFTFDPQRQRDFWFIREYASPDAIAMDALALSPREICEALGSARIDPVPVPHDCTDGFLGAYWRRPEHYLDADVRASISFFARLAPEQVEPGLERLAADLASGAWHSRHADLLERESLDLGYRLIIGEHRHGPKPPRLTPSLAGQRLPRTP